MLRPLDLQLSIILPSFNDPRIAVAIESVLKFDDLGCTRLLVMDGGSNPDLVAKIRSLVRAQDVVLSDKDEGIFDALNKGLSMVSTEFLGWLGSDDFFAPTFKASTLMPKLQETDILIANTAHFSGRSITRVTYSWPIRFSLNRYGLNNPHFSTFGRSSFLKQMSFNRQSPVADIEYFLSVFALKPRVTTIPDVATYMAEGGFSNRSWRDFVRNTRCCWSLYAKHNGIAAAITSIPARIVYKLGSRVLHASRSFLFPERSKIPDFGP